MKRSSIYKISQLIGIGLACLLYLEVNAQTKSTRVHRSHVSSVVSKPASSSLTTTVRKTVGFKPEPSGWYSGDIHVHRVCGESTDTIPEDKLTEQMEKNNLDVVAMLADIGKSEMKESKADLLKVNGKDAKGSVPGRIIRWDAEWHYEPSGMDAADQVIGGHLALLGLKEVHSIQEEPSYKILDWAKSQNAVTGFVSMKYFNKESEDKSSSCVPLDFPVEVALGKIDFVADDTWQNEDAVRAYYKLLNCGFRIGLVAGTDVPCTNGSMGDALTYVQVKEKPLTYEKWIDGIKNGRTVVSINGHNEFLDIKAKGTYSPGDEIKIKGQGDVNVMVRWTGAKDLTGRVELICNGKVVATEAGSVRAGSSVILTATQKFIRSGWLSARRMDEKGHVSLTSPIYVIVDDRPIRASIDDAKFFISWIDRSLENISAGGPWNKYFTHDLDTIKARYERARDIYIKIEDETIDQLKNMGNGVLDNGAVVKSPVKKTVKHKRSKYIHRR